MVYWDRYVRKLDKVESNKKIWMGEIKKKKNNLSKKRK